MRNYISGIFTEVTTYVSVPYLITFLLLAYFFKPYVSALVEGFLGWEYKRKADPHLVVAIIGLLVAIPFMAIPSWQTSGLKLFVTYSIGTSLYDLLIGRIILFFGKNSQ